MIHIFEMQLKKFASNKRATAIEESQTDFIAPGFLLTKRESEA